MTILLLKGYNNYFNRIVKKENTITAYKEASTSYLEYNKVNFDPNDGITTTLIVGNENQQVTIPPVAPNTEATKEVLKFDDLGNPDYLIVHDGTNIVSKWFILESVKIRQGQYKLALKRDVLADFYAKFMNAPCYIEKGFINNKENALLFNPENISLNQIKQSETLLKDETGSAWLVGYIKKDASATVTATPDQDIAGYEQADTLDWKDCITYIDPIDGTTTAATKTAVKNANIAVAVNAINFNIYNNSGTTNSKKWLCDIVGTPDGVLWNVNYYGATNVNYNNDGLIGMALNNVGSSGNSVANAIKNAVANNSTVKTAYNTFRTACMTQIIEDNNLEILPRNSDISAYDQQYIIKDSKLYQLSIVETGYSSYKLVGTYGSSKASDIAANNFFTVLSNNVSEVSINRETPTDKYATSWAGNAIAITATRIPTAGSVKAVIPTQGTRNQLSDELFDMFCIPYVPAGQPNVYFYKNQTKYAVDSSYSLFMATQIMTQLGTNPNASSGAGYGYDLQLLPYCPFNSLEIEADGGINLDALNNKSYNTIVTGPGTEQETPVSFILFPTNSNFTKNIEITRSTASLSAFDLKLKNETDFQRLVSPNYNGMFEFKISKLSGGLHYINVDCSYKPFTPYIKLNPDFSNLYGSDFNDSLGLLCGGDFSLPTLTDAWINYQLSNKNYQNVFNRSIENLDVNNQIARDRQAFESGVGILTGALAGAGAGGYAGFKMGGGVGALAGAAIGATSSVVLGAVGAQKDREWLMESQTESKAYSVDMYNYQLGNIKALPQSITKSSPLSYNNKIWPILEEYSCTDTEKEVLRNKIIYDGMTIMAIGRLADYSTSGDFDKVYVKGQLIRVEDIEDDFHIVDALYQEVNKGFYIPQGV